MADCTSTLHRNFLIFVGVASLRCCLILGMPSFLAVPASFRALVNKEAWNNCGSLACCNAEHEEIARQTCADLALRQQMAMMSGPGRARFTLTLMMPPGAEKYIHEWLTPKLAFSFSCQVRSASESRRA